MNTRDASAAMPRTYREVMDARFDAWWHRMMPHVVPGSEASDRAIAKAAWNAAILAEGSASSEGAEAEMRTFAQRLASAQKPFDPDVAKAIRDNWRKLFDDDTHPQPAQGEHEQRITVADVARLIECKAADVLRAGRDMCSLMLTANQMVSVEDAVLLARWTLHERRSCEGSERRQDWERKSMEFLAKKLRERGDELSQDAASWLEKFAVSAPERWPIADEVVEPALKAYAEDHLRLCDEGCTSHISHIRAALESALPRGLPAGSDVSRMDAETRAWLGGMEVSVDVSTSDETSGRRYFGTVTEVMDHRDGKHGVILLVQDAEPNFATAEQPSCGQDARDAALFAFPGDAIAHVYRAKWDAERGCYVSIDPPMVTHPLQQPVGHVRKHTGEFKDMAIIVWTNEQPPEGAALYLGPAAPVVEAAEPYPYRWRKPGGLWQYVRHPNREAFAEVLRDLEECGFEVERTGSDDAAIAAQQRQGGEK